MSNIEIENKIIAQLARLNGRLSGAESFLFSEGYNAYGAEIKEIRNELDKLIELINPKLKISEQKTKV